MKNTKDGLNKPCSWRERLTFIKFYLLINLFINFPINKCNHTITQIIGRFYFQNTVKLTLKLKQKNKHTRMIKKAQKKRNEKAQKKRNERYGKVCVCVCVRACMRACVRACARVRVRALSHARLFMTPQTVASQVPLSMGFSRQEYWSGLPFPTQRNFPNPGMEPASLISPALTGRFFTNCYHLGK